MTLHGGMRGACPPSPAPPASGKVPVPRTGRSTGGGAIGRQRRKIRNNVKLFSRFSAEVQSHVFAPACRLQSIGGGVRGWGRSGTGRDAAQAAAFSPPTPSLLHRAGTDEKRGTGGAELPSGISRRNAVTTHIPLPGSGILPLLFYAERHTEADCIFYRQCSRTVQSA